MARGMDWLFVVGVGKIIYVYVTLDVDIRCGSLLCANNATCVDELWRQTCICPPQFTGRECREDNPECASSPCANKGTCVEGFGGYTCECLKAFDGVTCQDQVGSCGLQTESEKAARATAMVTQTASCIAVIVILAIVLGIFFILRDFSVSCTTTTTNVYN